MQKSNLHEIIKDLGNHYFNEMVEIRRAIHRNPELSFEERLTASLVCQYLHEWEIPYQEHIAGTGVVAFTHGKHSGKSGRFIALRADMDALPVTETHHSDFMSQNQGIMHACGHDIHTSCLLGAAKILKQLSDRFEGTIMLLFQPGEEKLPGGASLMIEEGIFREKLPEWILGLHVMPEMLTGNIGFRSGVYMASADEVYITVKGRGGHAAMPEKLIDPVPIAAQIILSLQQVVSRKANPSIPTVLSFGKMMAEGATNIIPDMVSMEGTFRTFDEQWREEAHQWIRDIAERIAAAYGASCKVEIRHGYPVLINHEQRTQKAIMNAKQFLGESNIQLLPLRMTAEDFSWYSQIIPATFFRLGVKSNESHDPGQLHSGTFNPDERAIITGMSALAYLGLTYLLE